MDEVLSSKPIAALEKSDNLIKTYILLLERKLKNCILWENFNNEKETKCLDLEEELFSLKLQQQENKQQGDLHKKQMEKVNDENVKLKSENEQLKLEIIKLQEEIEKLKNNNCNQNNRIERTISIDNTENSDANSVLVKGFTKLQLCTIPKINIINLCHHMKIQISDKDIVKVKNKESKYNERLKLKPDKIQLIVEFRTSDLKVEFLKNKDKLKQQPDLADIEIIDYVSDEVFNLYQYAKMLKDHGFASIYWRNNCVYAKKIRSSLCDPILIKSKNDVDNLKEAKE
ncbi:repetitive organellar protein-like [Lucilia cuprina]|uniref:repetitive organellar protein-like n=1 Tax=Lucilia cuprina TaxID=7375 RepID=UPI001F0515F4|nr:repetitive organellar protein-like [Lucilia cuprina]